MKLVIYIDAKLMNPDPNTGLPQVGNLAFARKVAGGKPNSVVYLCPLNFHSRQCDLSE